MKTGVQKSKFDDSIFYWYINNKLEGLICCHVGDFFWGRTKHFAESVINKFKEKFLTHSEGFENFKYISLNLVQKDDCVYLDQQLYIDELKQAVIAKNRKMCKDSSLTTDEVPRLRGQLNWTSSQTCPDMSFGACEVSAAIKDAQIGDIVNTNKNIKSQQILLQFPNLMYVEECSIICFADAAFGNLKYSFSQGGYIVFRCKDQKKYAPISWESK